MKIDSYSFGHIVIDGRSFTSDVILYRDHVDASWWRQEGHRLLPEDLTDVLRARPDILIIGTGYSGIMTVPKNTVAHIESQGIEIKVERTTQAVASYNSLQGHNKHIIAALHLTC